MMELSITSKDLILTSEEAARMLKCSVSTLLKLKKLPGFPRPVKLLNSANSPQLWRLEDLYAWASAQQAAGADGA